MREDVELRVKSCEGCQKFKVCSDNKRPPTKPITPNFVGEIWATDIAVLPESYKGERYLLVFMEYLTKWVVSVPLRSFDTSLIVQALLYEVVLKYGLPTRLISDNGTNYISEEAMNVVCSRLGISKSLASVEHPQSDGLVERMKRTFKTSLSIVVGGDMKTWSRHLSFVVFAYNTARQASPKFSTFEVMFGRKAVLPLLRSIEVVNPKTYTTQQWSEFLNEEIPIIQSKALENIKKAQDQQAKQHDKKATKSLVKFKVGDPLLGKNHKKMMSFPKERWTGPWPVLEVTNKKARTAYKICKAEDPKAMSTVNVVDLRLFVRRGNDVVHPATVGAFNTRRPSY
ncbi:hypothetical protein [Parasitella parasitica]|uniref:Integrase catalytic domain-containing protein n=1 Tax=Parasitella parasitica TaxID=35722 RepID=A0A0B7NDR6_9FUNG|nr:hypothetical protein [Parasitella parasitica]